MTELSIEERLHKQERMQLKLTVELNVYKRAIWSLIATHPCPEVFAQKFEETTERAVAVHLNDELVTDEVREASFQYAMELVDLARQMQQSR